MAHTTFKSRYYWPPPAAAQAWYTVGARIVRTGDARRVLRALEEHEACLGRVGRKGGGEEFEERGVGHCDAGTTGGVLSGFGGGAREGTG